MHMEYGGASFSGLSCFFLGENGGKFVVGMTVNWAHQIPCERKKSLSKSDLCFINPQSVGWDSPSLLLVLPLFTRLLSPLQLPAGCCLFSSRWGRTGPVGEGVTDRLEQLAQLCCLLVNPRRETDRLSPPRCMNPSWDLVRGLERATR